MLIIHIFPPAGLVQQVEAYLFGGYILIPFGPETPVKIKSVLRSLVGPEVIGLMKARIDAIPRSTVQVEADMHIVLMRESNQLVDLRDFLFVDMIDLLRQDIPAAIELQVIRIRDRQTDEIEAPVFHPLEMIFRSRLGNRPGVRREKIQQVESLPLR